MVWSHNTASLQGETVLCTGSGGTKNWCELECHKNGVRQEIDSTNRWEMRGERLAPKRCEIGG